jgi:hypothetical protein
MEGIPAERKQEFHKLVNESLLSSESHLSHLDSPLSDHDFGQVIDLILSFQEPAKIIELTEKISFPESSLTMFRKFLRLKSESLYYLITVTALTGLIQRSTSVIDKQFQGLILKSISNYIKSESESLV